MRTIRLSLLAALCALAAPAWADDLAPTSMLRAVFLAQNPVQAVTDAKTGEVRGPAAELAAELAKRLGVPFTIKGVPGTAAVMDAVKSGAADVGFLAYDPQRAQEVDFSQAYSLAQNTYMVLESSPLRGNADIDRAGQRIGVAERDAGDLFLSRTLKNATLIRNPGGNLDTALAKLRAGEIDAYAANRQRLSEFAARNTGVRLFADNFYGVEQAIVVRKGNPGLALIERMLDEARASGLVAGAITRAGLVGVDVAPPRSEQKR